MAKKHPFVINDENVLNSYGFRVMTAGINLVQFKKNPLILWMHKRSKRWSETNDPENEVLPIGTASNLRKKGGQLLADIEFDQEDDFAKKIEQKVESGIIRMTSPGLDPVALSEEAKFLLPGQTRMTLTKSDLIEISIVDIGSNPNALKLALYNSESELITLSNENLDSCVPALAKEDETANTNITLKTKNMEFMKQVAVLLAMNPDASQESIMEALTGKLELAKTADSLQLKHDELANQVKLINDNAIVSLVDANVDKKFTADKRDDLIKLGKESGRETLESVINMMPNMVKPAGMVNLSSGKGGATKIEKFEDLITLGKESLEKFRDENREDYIKLYKTHYGFEPSFDKTEELRS